MNQTSQGKLNRKPWVILLSGTSGSGKTTLARALQQRLSSQSRPFLNMEADELVPHLSKSWPTTQDPSRAFSRALRRAIAAFADEGLDIIVDGLLPYGDPDGIADTLALFGRYRLCYVGVHCDLEVLEQRERHRPNRVAGWARQQFTDLHKDANYDLEVDTTCTAADENAERILQHLIDQDPSLVCLDTR